MLEAARGGAALVVLPEYFALMGLADTDKLAVAEAFGHGPMQDAVAQMAREAGVWLVVGTLPLAGQNPGRVRNRCLVFSPAGEDAWRSATRSTSSAFPDWASVIANPTPSSRVTRRLPLTAPLGRLGLSVCYGLRFPELRHLGEMTALVLAKRPAPAAP